MPPRNMVEFVKGFNMKFAGFGQWRVAWLQRGMALARERRPSPGDAMPAALTPTLTEMDQGELPSACCLPQGMMWGADGVTEIVATASPASLGPSAQMPGSAHHAGEPLPPDRLRVAGAI